MRKPSQLNTNSKLGLIPINKNKGDTIYVVSPFLCSFVPFSIANVKMISISRIIFENNVDLWRKVCYTFVEAFKSNQKIQFVIVL